jgi:hypothetical protein
LLFAELLLCVRQPIALPLFIFVDGDAGRYLEEPANSLSDFLKLGPGQPLGEKAEEFPIYIVPQPLRNIIRFPKGIP